MRAGIKQKQPPKKNVDIGQIISGLISEKKYSEASILLKEALKYKPSDAKILELLALCWLRLGNYAAARETYFKALKIAPHNFIILEGLAETCGLSARMDEAAEFGTRCLELKAKLVSQATVIAIPDIPPPRLSENLNANVIAFTLFGNNPRYCETAILNVEQAQILFPLWTCRFYVDHTVPNTILQRLKYKGAQIIQVANEIRESISPLMWRFLVIDDIQVDRFLLRD